MAKNKVEITFDEDVEIEGMEDIEQEQTLESLSYSDDDPNLAVTFELSTEGQEESKRLVKYMMDAFDEEWEAQSEYRQKATERWKSFIGHLKAKSFPFENCANINVPIAYENIVRLHFRMVGELFGDWTNVVGVPPIGTDDMEAASLLSKHSNWQMSEQIRDFPRQAEKALLMFLVNGDVVCDSYFDPLLGTNRHEILGVDDFIAPNDISSSQPDFSDCSWVARIRRYKKNELQLMKATWNGVEEILEKKSESDNNEPERVMKEASDEVSGLHETTAKNYEIHKIIQWEGYLDLPQQQKQRYCRAYIHYDSNTLLSLSIHEQAPWSEIERFNKQQAELDDYRIRKDNFLQAQSMIEQSTNNIYNNPDISSEEKMQMSFSQPVPQPPPMPPTWIDTSVDEDAATPPPKKMKPIHMFSHGVCIEPLEGSKGFGFGQLVSDLNVAANTLIDQFIDAATVANTNELISTDLITFKKPFKSRPGAIHKVSGVSGDELAKNLLPLQKSPANSQLFDVMNMLLQWGQSAIQSPDVLSGDPGKSGETFRGITARIEQATKQLSVITRKFSKFIAQIYKNNARLNAIYLDETEFFMINNDKLGTMEQLEIGRALYRREYSVTFRSDMRYTSDSQKIQEADELLQLSLSVPQVAQNFNFVMSAFKKALEARDLHDMVEILDQSQEQMRQQHQMMMQQQQAQQGGMPQ